MPQLKPSGPPVNVFGYLREMRRDALSFSLSCAEKYGDVVEICYGLGVDFLRRKRGIKSFILNCPDDVRHVLVTNQHNYRKLPFPPAGQRLFGQGLLTSEDPLHRCQRQVIQPFFHQRQIKSYAKIMVDQTKMLLDSWDDKTSIDVVEEMTGLTLSIACKSLFDIEIGEKKDRLAKAVQVTQHHTERRFNSFFGFFPFIEVLPTSANRRFQKAIKTLDQMILEIIESQASQNNNYSTSASLLSMLVHARDEEGHPMLAKQIRDEALTLFLAGHETTANALSWTFYLLSEHPDVEFHLVKELQDVLQGRSPSMADIPKLLYSGQVFSEAMRLYPPAWALGVRTAQNDDQLPSGTRISALDDVNIFPYVIHRDPRFYPEPTRFDPDRFLPDAKQERPPYSYFPFGGGARSCIGESFARMEGTIILASLVQRFRMKRVSNQAVVPEPLITLRPKHPILMTISGRS
ncbi:MAG: cytochrome P450 [Nitrospiria bacterium]